MNDKQWDHYMKGLVTGYDTDMTMLRISTMNLMLHSITNPTVEYQDAVSKANQIKGQYDVILANPPFGASVSDGVETNYPAAFRTTESADLFLLLMIRYLREGGRAAIVLPDGSLTGDGVKQRIREEFLKSCCAMLST